MMRALIISCLVAASASADTVVPTRTLRPGTLISAADLTVLNEAEAGMFEHVADVIGQEARTALYAGRPIPFDAIGAPAIVNRNQIVPLFFNAGGLSIATEGRALERGGVGDRVRVMNLSSRSSLFGFVQEDGSVKVTR
ncbi:flagella basal body P-ring formation protein FlgA [Tateyamaria omphalii]|uniref:flagellar basal body P-ring formation chaperone FlgA n=1 Tax=Tateyamaria omphalii TaxID=299262 RepID=UPI0016744398|nr:flagellar basal body P-ring formation chaperone FlgA [Tateyamaria omphalii]GGX38381.1 flagella basal body P-ring formation protein FlgA [Tateyamaria omphalii]